MAEWFKDIYDKIKEERYPAYAAWGIIALLMAAGFWGVIFPRYMFTGDCVRILDEEGNDVTEEAGADKNLFVEIGSAEPEDIEIEFGILEWIKK